MCHYISQEMTGHQENTTSYMFVERGIVISSGLLVLLCKCRCQHRSFGIHIDDGMALGSACLKQGVDIRASTHMSDRARVGQYPTRETPINQTQNTTYRFIHTRSTVALDTLEHAISAQAALSHASVEQCLPYWLKPFWSNIVYGRCEIARSVHRKHKSSMILAILWLFPQWGFNESAQVNTVGCPILPDSRGYVHGIFAECL